MIATMALAAGVLGGAWWLRRGSRRARVLYRRWRWRNSIAVYGYDEPGRAWQIDAALAAVLALAGPFAPQGVDAGRVWRAVYLVVGIVWLVYGAPPLGAWR
jgi:hypothetical protein